MKRIAVWMGVLLAVGAARGGDVTTRCNPVDSARVGFSSAEAFPPDTVGEADIGATDVDWRRLTMAHERKGGFLYLRYELEKAANMAAYPAFYNVFVDVDRKRDTGYIGGGGQLSVGAEFLIQGPSVFAFTGASQTDFSWVPVGTGKADAGQGDRDVTVEIPLALLGSPRRFQFVLHADNGLSGHTADYYPDGAERAASGDCFSYRVDGATSGARAASKP